MYRDSFPDDIPIERVAKRQVTKKGQPTKTQTRFKKQVTLPDGSKQFGKAILNDPQKFFTEDIMAQLDTAASKEFLYGIGSGDNG